MFVQLRNQNAETIFDIFDFIYTLKLL